MQTQTKKYLRRALTIGGLCLVLAGCDFEPMPTIQMEKEAWVESTNQTGQVERYQKQSPKYDVKRVAVFDDDLAYNSKRGIYEITDKETGKTYIGVSGIGITERGSHNNGKMILMDER